MVRPFMQKLYRAKIVPKFVPSGYIILAVLAKNVRVYSEKGQLAISDVGYSACRDYRYIHISLALFDAPMA